MSRPLPRRIKDDPHIRLWQNFFDECDDNGIPMAAQMLYLRMACRCRQLRSDGWIHDGQIEKLGVKGWQKMTPPLTLAGLIQDYPDMNGRRRWFLPAYPKWNKTEEDYTRDRHNGRIGGCTSKHDQPCAIPECLESAAWLGAHPVTPTSTPRSTPTSRGG